MNEKWRSVTASSFACCSRPFEWALLERLYGLILLVRTFWCRGQWEQGLQLPKPCTGTPVGSLNLSWCPCVSSAKCHPLPCCCFRSWAYIERSIEQLNQCFLKPLVENILCLLWWTDSPSPHRLSTSAGSWASRLIAGGFALLALPRWPAKRLLTQKTRHVCACKWVCKGILPKGSACALLMNISVFTLGEEEQSWAIADVAGGAGPRWCPQGRDPPGRASLCSGRRLSPGRASLCSGRRLSGAHSAACESQGRRCDRLMTKLNYPPCSSLSKRLWCLQKWDDYNGHSARSQG